MGKSPHNNMSQFDREFRWDELCDRFESLWQDGQRPSLASFLMEVDETEREELFRELLPLEIEYRQGNQEQFTAGEYITQYPGYSDQIALVFADVDRQATISLHDQRISLQDSGQGPPTDSFPGYQIIREIHRGGQGVVYEALQFSTQRTVAVKVLLEGSFAGDHSKWRFEREVKLVADLKHPNIVVIHDSGIAQGKYYFAMDYIRGGPLDTYVKIKQLPLRDIVRLFLQLCEAVAYAHRRGVIHRDLKPSNVLVSDEGCVHVLDFGLAKIINEEREDNQRRLATLSGYIMGTIRYMSPEQTMGQPDLVDMRTDIYALGVILYELLVQAPPYETGGEPTRAIKNIREVDPARPSRLCREANSEIDAIVLKAMTKEPDRRYQSAAEFREDLLAWLDGRPVTARSDSALYVLRKLAARHGFETAVVITLLVSVVSFAAISVQYYLRAEKAGEKQAASEHIATQVAADYEITMPQVSSTMADYTLGWFLLEWHAGRLNHARSIQNELAPLSPPFRAVMDFLLDETITVDRLRGQLPKEAGALLYFTVGERAMKAGRTEEALKYFEASKAFPAEKWLKSCTQARIDQLLVRTDRKLQSQPHNHLQPGMSP